MPKATNVVIETEPHSDCEYEADHENDDYKYAEYNDHIKILKYLNDEENVTIPEKIDGLPVISIGDNAFNGKEKIKSVVLPFGLLEIGVGAFENCALLAEISFKNRLTSISPVRRSRSFSKMTVFSPLVIYLYLMI